jgi:hypothetical protein
VATEIDVDATLLGGSVALINAALRSPALEAWPIRSEDSLAAADLVMALMAAPAIPRLASNNGMSYSIEVDTS